MWCSTCQQDVPAIASPEDRQIRCARCRGDLNGKSNSPSNSTPDDTDKPAKNTQPEPAVEVASPFSFFDVPFEFDDWQCDKELREAGRVIRSWNHAIEPSPPPVQLQSSLRRDLPTNARSTSPRKSVRASKKTPRRRGSSIAAWLFLSLGVMAFVFGGVLLGWSFVKDRSDLWTLGLPFAIVGQAALIFGLVLQLDGLWQSNHEAVESLTELDEQLVELRRATSQISASHSGPGQSFYFHLAEGCSPHMLLADLKGQLDLLAMRISDEK